MAKAFYTDIDLSNSAKVINMPQSTASGEAVEHDQLVSGLSQRARVYRETSVTLQANIVYTVNHGFAEDNVLVQVSEASTGMVVTVGVDLMLGATGNCAVASTSPIVVDILVVG